MGIFMSLSRTCCFLATFCVGFFALSGALVYARVDAIVGPPVASAVPVGDGWVEMPEGARPAYIGIHGGTVPVSLLTASDGSSMVTFVGKTGNDFLRILYKTNIKHPNSLNEMRRQDLGSNATLLKADTAIGNVPVFYCTGRNFARMDLDQEQWMPFGLSEKPLSLEGQAGKPVYMEAQDKNKKYRKVLWQQRTQRHIFSSR